MYAQNTCNKFMPHIAVSAAYFAFASPEMQKFCRSVTCKHLICKTGLGTQQSSILSLAGGKVYLAGLTTQ